MLDTPKTGWEFIRWILGLLIVLYIGWLLTGGLERVENKDKPFIKEPDPLDSGEVYGPGETTEEN